jgi:hypothetical protein
VAPFVSPARADRRDSPSEATVLRIADWQWLPPRLLSAFVLYVVPTS